MLMAIIQSSEMTSTTTFVNVWMSWTSKAEGERKSKRAKLDRQPLIGSYMLDSSQIELSDDVIQSP